MYTSIVLVALAGSALSAAGSESLDWKNDYVTARTLGSRESKPLAVFIGSGPKGWEQRTTEGQLSEGAQKLLQAHYVCVYIDTSSEAGRQLARSFAMDEGLVLSDKTTANQAFRHAGKLSNSDLEVQLTKFSDPARVVTRTETNSSTDVRYYPSDSSYPSSIVIPSSSYCPSCSNVRVR